ncbi:gliding motility-associated C-terminal domain-containing protein [Hymenobacter sp. B81]|uniref:T9SS type B sorting domain-containing protein n=1 Tax=Hymenobacter sp. B81 TaxID=3344878 RepID=UPI0037DC7670
MLYLLLRRLGRPGHLLCLLLLALLAAPEQALASHIRAGDIQARSDTTLPVSARNPRRVFFKMILYMDPTSPAIGQREETIYFGDGTRSVPQVPVASELMLSNNVLRRTYLFEHTYNAPGSYVVSLIGENRVGTVRNMLDPINQTFYIYTRVTIDPVLGVNSSPVLNAPAVDLAAVRQVYLHNPAASDADGDSLVFKLQICKQEPRGVLGTNVGPPPNRPSPQNCTGYKFPNSQDPDVSPGGVQVAFDGPPAPVLNAPAIFEIDVNTGQLVWNSPSTVGEYNAAFLVEEWRRVPGAQPRLIGEVLRDMQISVRPTNNLRPVLRIPKDTCVVAGTTVIGRVTATDANNNLLRLQAFGGMLPPATFSQTVSQPGNAQGLFRWTTTCDDVASDPHQVLFKVEDVINAPGVPLTDQKAWRIKVVGPPPTGVLAQRMGANVIVTWNLYGCNRPGVKLHLYRKEGPSNFSPDACQTGIPASTGFVRIATLGGDAQSYLDTRGGQGMERGKTYCYRIYAEFPRPAGGESLASAETCVEFDGRPAVLTHVTVDRTDATNGQITVRWTQPKPGTNPPFNAPLGYRLARAPQSSPTAFQTIATFNRLSDTVLVDTGLNTLGSGYTYRLTFFSKATAQAADTTYIREIADPASSVRLSGRADTVNTGIVLTWAHAVPWNNSLKPATIFRRDASGNFVQLATAANTQTGGSYTDRNVQVGRTYCYYVRTEGSYDDPLNIGLPQNLVNLSQELCVQPTPCRPILTVRATNCDSLNANLFNLGKVPAGTLYTNRLSWVLDSNSPAGCSQAIAYYRLFVQNEPGAAFVLLDSTRQTSYVHDNLPSAALCYRVQAVDSLGQRSALSNVACNDNCPLFLLPNIFTPNGDGLNETFTPKVASPVTRARVQIFNRWGVQVYKGDANPATLVLWDGGGARGGEGGGRDSGARVSDGIYYYLVEVEFADRNKTQKTFKGWVDVKR